MIGVSESPEAPTESLCIEYLKATRRIIFVLDSDIALMHSLPDSRRSATLKNR